MTNPFEYKEDPPSPSNQGDSEPNPYAPPATTGSPHAESRTGQIIAAWAIGILAVPSVIIVFFTTCFFSGLLMFDMGGGDAAVLIAIIVGLVASGTTIYMFIRLIRATLGRRRNAFDEDVNRGPANGDR